MENQCGLAADPTNKDIQQAISPQQRQAPHRRTAAMEDESTLDGNDNFPPILLPKFTVQAAHNFTTA